jgi:hypothetical protein
MFPSPGLGVFGHNLVEQLFCGHAILIPEFPRYSVADFQRSSSATETHEITLLSPIPVAPRSQDRKHVASLELIL